MSSGNPSHESEDRQLRPASRGSRTEQTIEVVKRNWQADVATAQTYRDLAGRERDEKRKGVLLRMAEAEERHAQRWEKKFRDLGEEPPVLNDTIGRRLSRWWNKIAGAEIAIRRMEATEERQEAEFHEQAGLVLTPVNRTCRNFCGRARLRKRRTRARLAPWHRRLPLHAPRWTKS